MVPRMTIGSHNGDRLLTAGAVGEILRVPRSTVYELARTRRIPFLKVGRRTLFTRSCSPEWIAEQTVPARPGRPSPR